jgi:hypothetical protein
MVRLQVVDLLTVSGLLNLANFALLKTHLISHELVDGPDDVTMLGQSVLLKGSILFELLMFHFVLHRLVDFVSLAAHINIIHI